MHVCVNGELCVSSGFSAVLLTLLLAFVYNEVSKKSINRVLYNVRYTVQ